MPIQFVPQLAKADQALMHQAVDGFVPREVFDAHTHIFHSRHFAEGKRPEFIPADTAFGLRQFNETMTRWLPGRVVHGMFFGYPSAGNDRAGENAFVAGEIAAARTTGISRALALLAPEDDPAWARQLIARHRFVGIKPYRLYARVTDTAQAAIEDFAPEWMWGICNEFDGVLMLHIVRSPGVADDNNRGCLRRLCRKYPRCRVVLAHVARLRREDDGRLAVCRQHHVGVPMHDLEAGHVRDGALEAAVLAAGDDQGVETVLPHGCADIRVAPLQLCS